MVTQVEMCLIHQVQGSPTPGQIYVAPSQGPAQKWMDGWPLGLQKRALHFHVLDVSQVQQLAQKVCG